jgi:hypothetical protein
MAGRIISVVASLVIGAVPCRACPGDCDGDGTVTVAEVITVVSEALGAAVAPTCAEADVDGDGSVRIDEIVTAVSTVLAGCPAPVLIDVTGFAGVDYRQASALKRTGWVSRSATTTAMAGSTCS